MVKDFVNWVMIGCDYNVQNYFEMIDINKENVRQLCLVWLFLIGVLYGYEGMLLVVGDWMFVYLFFFNMIFVLDLNELGKIVWMNKFKQNFIVWMVVCCDVVNWGLVYWLGDGDVKLLIFCIQFDGYIVVMDVEIGEMCWIMENLDIKVGLILIIVFYVIKDMVLVGLLGVELGVCGYVIVYDVKFGEMCWCVFVIGLDEELLLVEDFNVLNLYYGQKNFGIEIWEGDVWKIGGGINWGWYVYDLDEDLFYYGLGNLVLWNEIMCLGDNKWIMVIWGCEVIMGQVKFVYQKMLYDEWDYVGVNVMMLFE